MSSTHPRSSAEHLQLRRRLHPLCPDRALDPLKLLISVRGSGGDSAKKDTLSRSCPKRDDQRAM